MLAGETQAVTCMTVPTSMSAQQAYYALTRTCLRFQLGQAMQACLQLGSHQKQAGPASGWRAICSHAPGACAQTHLPL
jgi:hypothetical protein